MNIHQGNGSAPEPPLRIGVSACLLGQPVRYDGGHKHDRWITGELGRYVEFVPVCPEVEAGLGVPREAMRLVGDPAAPRLVTVNTKRDMTTAMTQCAARRVEELAGEDLCGFIFKNKSPSSGMARVKVYPEEGGMPAHTGVGLFAKAFMERFPLLPVEEEGRLCDARLRENFIERIFVLRAWRDMLDAIPGEDAAGLSRELTRFHARHKLLIMAHSPSHARLMGALAADAKGKAPKELLDAYEKLLLEALGRLATTARNVNVLQHMAGYFRKLATQDERAELAEVIEAYRAGLVPLIVPVTLVKHHVRKHGVEYLAGQVYLNPHPLELKLRNYY
ncbi:YbgA family protein [Fundidesulfovibrio terrae]|uniref:YbgA family protein n=1 Tax=Fundidesulfovibrio terrae TaxID=2922866 RepID=UPI001FAF7085|nr:DUF523 and DUF1722 domain-containing protein [Fundidesulfovibrio terrae]